MKKYKQLSTRERQVIHREFKKGTSIGTIAKILDRNKSTISREIKRNSSIDEVTNQVYYNHKEAHRKYIQRFRIKKRKASNRPIAADGQTGGAIESQLRKMGETGQQKLERDAGAVS